MDFRRRQVLKEGGKRGVEIEGAADMGGLQWAGPRLGLAHPRQRNGPKMPQAKICIRKNGGNIYTPDMFKILYVNDV